MNMGNTKLLSCPKAGDEADGRGRFTLVELLVVIAVIALLAALLLPALKNARELAKQINCLNNQKQIGLSVMGYVNDCNGWFPSCYSGAGAVYGMYHTYTWVWAQKECNASILPFQCPSATNPYDPKTDIWYGMNVCLNSGRVNSGLYSGTHLNISKVANPSRAVLLGDKYDKNGDSYAQSLDFGANLNISRAPSFLRHPGYKINHVFIDQHATALKWSEFSGSSAVAAYASGVSGSTLWSSGSEYRKMYEDYLW